MLGFHEAGVPTFDYGNNIRQEALGAGVENAFDFPGFVPAYVRPLFCRGIGPFRWAALSGDPEDIYRTDAKVKELIPDDPHLHHWLDAAREKIHFQGLPARICWVGLGQRDRIGLAFNEMVRSGELRAPVVIGRDHLDSGSVASPNRETEAMRDGSDAVSDWAFLNAMLNTASGATWVFRASRRRRRHGVLAARRVRHRLRWQRSRRPADRTRALERPRDRGHAARRRRVRGGDRLCERARPQPAHGPGRQPSMRLKLDGSPLSLAQLREAWRTPLSVELSESTRRRIDAAAEAVSRVIAEGTAVYGVNTGFGQLAQVRIEEDELAHLQENLVRSHAAGVGKDLGDEVVRLVILLKVMGARPAVIPVSGWNSSKR